MKNKKWVLLVVMLFLGSNMVFAQRAKNKGAVRVGMVGGKVAQAIRKLAPDPTKPAFHRYLTMQQVIEYIQSPDQLLPLHFGNGYHCFRTEADKNRAVEEVNKVIKAHPKLHRAYYNAAVVYATPWYCDSADDPHKLDVHEAANARRYAQIALNLSSATPQNVPYMYYILGWVNFDQGLRYVPASYQLQDRAVAQDAWNAYKEVERLSPELAPYVYGDMYTLAEALGFKKEAAKYRQKAGLDE